MKRDFLKEQGLTEEQINAVMAQYGQEVNPLQDQIHNLTAERDGYVKQLGERDNQLKDLSAKAKGNEELQATIDKLKKSAQEAETNYHNELAKQQKSFAIDKALTGAGALNNKAVSALLNMDNVEYKEGTLTGLDDQLTALKESDGYLFKQETQQPQDTGKVTITAGQPKPNTGAKIDLSKATYQEIMAFKEEHPQEYAELAEQ
ncbi:phage scaffolding protein [Ligilactobacillus equi]|uniref:Phage minor structural protein GP20 n=1 Tax=Ligilactobacillus equi DPC 6820 TaxID=1392007 RepID=V7I0V6_9LACO|nr:phage scaffolding protein [Ligilactobacillus equi]ETA75088.1 phage minor structural protein GP20 [Ligilactobacillus equi DPC 6820]